MLFVRLVGCSVGQKVCTHCDTDFSAVFPALGGGHFSAQEVVALAGACEHVCITGGEPLDRDLRPLLLALTAAGKLPHVETSGTVRQDWLDPVREPFCGNMEHAVGMATGGDRLSWRWMKLWITVSPKPGYRDDMVAQADEVKVIIGGLGDGPGWPTVDDALRWASAGKLVYVQPRNDRTNIRLGALHEALNIVAKHPSLRLSVQLHKFVRTR